ERRFVDSHPRDHLTQLPEAVAKAMTARTLESIDESQNHFQGTRPQSEPGNIQSPYQGTRSVGHGIRASRNSFLSFFPRPLLSLRASPFRPQAPFVDLESVSNQAKEILL